MIPVVAGGEVVLVAAAQAKGMVERPQAALALWVAEKKVLQADLVEIALPGGPQQGYLRHRKRIAGQTQPGTGVDNAAWEDVAAADLEAQLALLGKKGGEAKQAQAKQQGREKSGHGFVLGKEENRGPKVGWVTRDRGILSEKTPMEGNQNHHYPK